VTSSVSLGYPNGTRTHDISNGLYIDGHWETGTDSFVVFNPATNEAIGEFASASIDDALRALDAAVAAQPAWTAVTPRVRAEMMHALLDEVRKRGDSIVEAMVLESGKPIA
jgi:succinate-semialdehyde dehydrogenase/glutarate-semialdehyde dehydrogenase